jgi:hypothetical protein
VSEDLEVVGVDERERERLRERERERERERGRGRERTLRSSGPTMPGMM